MIKILFEAILQIAILIPFAFFLLKDKSKINFQRLLIFAVAYVVYQIVLVLPKINSNFDFTKSSWNWDGKIYGIICGILFYVLFRKFFRENDFFTLKQNKENFKPALVGAISIVLLSTIIWFLLGNSKFNLETLAFQISLPGIDEEIMFRGILLGLLTTALKDKISFLGNPSVLLTANVPKAVLTFVELSTTLIHLLVPINRCLTYRARNTARNGQISCNCNNNRRKRYRSRSKHAAYS